MRHLIQTLGFGLLTACGASTLESAVEPRLEARSRLSEMLVDELPGVQYVVVDTSGVVFEAALGVRDAASGEPMARDTLQMAYSMTKAVTAVAVLQLIGSRKLELEQPLSRYYPDHPYGSVVTIRSLLAQTSGVPNPLPLDWFSPEGVAFERDQKLQEQLRENPELDHAPGSEYAYSNLSHWLLEKAIEGATGQDYGDYVQRHIFAPLSVSDEAVRFSPGAPALSATGHSRRFTPMNAFVQVMSPSEYWQAASGPWSRSARVVPHGRGYGGLFTHASALARLLQDLLQETPTLLSPEAKRVMFSRQTLSDGTEIDMALGWVIGELTGQRYFGKQGGGLGFHGNLRIYPELGLATVLLANRTELSPGPIDARSDELDAVFVAAERPESQLN